LIDTRPCRLPGVRLFLRPPNYDDRGSFRRIFSQTEYAVVGCTEEFLEDNVSVSKHGVLRGLHVDARLAKFVQVLDGEVFDVVVDLREGSPTFGSWEGFYLGVTGGEQLLVPRGFAHGFYVTGERAIVAYKQSASYDPDSERQLRWNDPQVGIRWPLDGEPLVSAKDAAAPWLESFRSL
jgi:dTDP-4-dehydrorhamnose 3,5-epimerase